jgi:hypothetical protein
MDLGVIEVVVSRKKDTLMSFLKILLVMLAVCFILIAMLFIGAGSFIIGLLALAIGIGAAVGGYFAGLNVQIDYEYSLVDRELRVARINNKEKRKFMGSYDLDKMEILAPEKSYQLGSYKNRKAEKEFDYSDKEESGRYILWLEDKSKFILTLRGEEAQTMLSEIRRFAPRKVVLE